MQNVSIYKVIIVLHEHEQAHSNRVCCFHNIWMLYLQQDLFSDYVVVPCGGPKMFSRTSILCCYVYIF